MTDVSLYFIQKFEKWKNRRQDDWNNFNYAIELWGTTCTKIEGKKNLKVAELTE